MQKIPCLFKREFEGHNITHCYPVIEIPDGVEILTHGIPTIKYDGSCCMIADGRLYKRYDAKKGKLPPKDAIPCMPAPDPITGHWPHWVLVDKDKPEDQWFVEAWNNSRPTKLITVADEKAAELKLFHEEDGETWERWENVGYENGTYEAVGPHFQANPYRLDKDYLYRHGTVEIKDLVRTFDGVKQWLEQHNEEGLVFWLDGVPRAKIKRSDFGIPWNRKE